MTLVIPCAQCSGTGYHIEMVCSYCKGLGNAPYFLDGNILIGSEWKGITSHTEGKKASILEFDATKNEYVLRYNNNGTARISEKQLVENWQRISAPDPDWEDE